MSSPRRSVLFVVSHSLFLALKSLSSRRWSPPVLSVLKLLSSSAQKRVPSLRGGRLIVAKKRESSWVELPIHTLSASLIGISSTRVVRTLCTRQDHHQSAACQLWSGCGLGLHRDCQSLMCQLRQFSGPALTDSSDDSEIQNTN